MGGKPPAVGPQHKSRFYVHREGQWRHPSFSVCTLFSFAGCEFVNLRSVGVTATRGNSTAHLYVSLQCMTFLEISCAIVEDFLLCIVKSGMV